MSMESSERRDTGSGVLDPPPPMMERGWVLPMLLLLEAGAALPRSR